MKASLCLNDRLFLLRRSAVSLPLAFTCLLATGRARAQQTTFTSGNLVVAVEGCGVYGGTCTVPGGNGTGTGNSSLGGYGDNQAAPLTLFQFSPVGTTSVAYVNSLVLPQTASGANFPVSSEYGSSSEATLQLSGNGQFLTVLGYGVNAAAFDANPQQYGTGTTTAALGQSGSLTGQSYTAVSRVLALVDARGNVSSSTALYNIFNTNNPRSAFTQDGTSVYTSGQGASGDTTGGVFYSRTGIVNTAPTPITGLDTTSNTAAQDTRAVQIVNNSLLISVDSKAGSGAARDFIGTLGTPGTLPTTVGAPTMLNGFGNSGGTGKVAISGNGNGLNEGMQINLSPQNFFFASASVLYVADGGSPKNNSATSALGDGGLQKWINTKADGSGTWNLAYTLASGLKLVANTTSTGVSGLYGLAGRVVNGQAQLYATSFTLNDLDTTYLYGITDTLSAATATQAAGEVFSVLATAPKDSNFKGVSFTPTVAPETNLVAASTWKLVNGGYSLTVTIRNSGPQTAEDVTLTGVTVGTTALAVSPTSLGSIASGGTATTTLTVPSTVGAPGATVVERLSGTYTGGSLSASQRAQLPTQF